MGYYVRALKKYVEFNGRDTRKQYWMFVLFNLLISIALSILDQAFGLDFGARDMGILSSLYSLALLLPGLAAGSRRLHDTGKSAWWLLIALIPLVGIIALIVMLVLRGDEAENKYGPKPVEEVKAAPAA